MPTILSRPQCVNWLRLSDAYMYQYTEHLNQMLEYCKLRANFSEMLIEIHTFSFDMLEKMHLKMTSAKGGHFVSALVC